MNLEVNYNSKNRKVNQSAPALVVWGVILLVAFTILNTSQYGASLSWMVVPCCIIFWGWLMTFKQVSLLLRKEWIVLFIFWAVFLISTLISDIVEIERNILTFLLFCVVYVCATSFTYNTRQIRMILKCYSGVALFANVNILYNWFTHNYYNVWFSRSSFSFAGVYKDPNYVMAFIAPSIAIAFIKAVNARNNRSRLLNGLFLIISALSIFATGSRSPMLVMVVFFILYFFIPSKMGIKKKISIVSCGILIVVAALIFVKKNYSIQALQRLISGSDDPRWKLWESALTVFKEHPILGGGMSAASTVSHRNIGRDSHNVYLDILCNSGIIGTTFFVMFVWMSCLKTTKQNRVFIYSMFATFMLPMFFINGFNTATFYTPLILMSIMSKYCRTLNNCYFDFL